MTDIINAVNVVNSSHYFQGIKKGNRMVSIGDFKLNVFTGHLGRGYTFEVWGGGVENGINLHGKDGRENC
jgi:hypothetical protein